MSKRYRYRGTERFSDFIFEDENWNTLRTDIDLESIDAGDLLFWVRFGAKDEIEVESIKVAKKTRTGSIILTGFTAPVDLNNPREDRSTQGRRAGAFKGPFFRSEAEAYMAAAAFLRQGLIPSLDSSIQYRRDQVEEAMEELDLVIDKRQGILSHLKGGYKGWKSRKK